MKKLLILIFTLNIFAGDFFYEYGKKVELTPDQNRLRDVNNIGVKYYTTKDGKYIGIKNEIIIKLKEHVNATHFFASYQINDAKKLSNRVYVIKVYDNQNIFTLLQNFHNNPNTVYALPNRITQAQKR